MAKKNPDAPLTKGDRVVVTVPLPGVPEGTAGKLKIVNGLGTWMRAWVQFDNGVWMGSIGLSKLTRAENWPEFQVRRAADAQAKANGAVAESAAPAAAAASDADAAPAAGSAAAAAGKVPAHLLERAQKARERKAAAAAAGE